MRRFLALSSIALVAAFGAAAADERIPATQPPDDIAALNPLSTLDRATLDGFRDAPLFTPSRTRPEPPPAPVAEVERPEPEPVEASPAEPPTLKLAGIATGPEGAIAFISKEGAEAIEQLRLGDQIDGWLVTAIDPDALKLTLDDRDQEYRLFAKPPSEERGEADDADPDDKASGDDDASDDSAAAPEEEDKEAEDKADRNSGLRHEMDAARKAQRNSQRRQRLTPDQIGPE